MNLFRLLCGVVIVCSLLCSGTVCSADPLSQEGAAGYRNAVELFRNHQHADALSAFVRLVQAYDSNKSYQFGRLAALVEIAKEEKERNNDAWKGKAKEAAAIIKQMYRQHMTDPEYYLVSARYYTLIERERELDVVIRKALHYRADPAETDIVKGDAYFWLARMTDPQEVKERASVMSASPNLYARHDKAMKSKAAYDAALKTASLAGERKAYAYSMLSELERTMFRNKDQVTAYRMKAAEASPGSFWGKKSAEALRTGRD